MSKKISLNPKYTNNSGNSWSTTTYNGLEYHISTNKTSSSVSTLKCEFTTPYDNIDIVIEIGSSSENNFDWCYVGKLNYFSASYDSNYLDRISGRQSNNNPLFKTVTINVAKAGTHFLIIGYRKDGSGSYGNDCGYFRLVTTEVDSTEPNKYIYCGTKTTVVSEEPIRFTKKNVSYGSGGSRNWSEYQGSNKDYLWEAAVGDNGYKTAKISFTTLSDNTIVTLKYDVFWRFTDERFTVSELDSTKSFVSENGPCSKKVTKEIMVPKAGEHFITIGYESSYFNGTYAYVGFSGTNVVTNTRTLVPESILANNINIDEVYVGSELIWEKSKYLWTNKPSLNINFYKQYHEDKYNKVTWQSRKYDKYIEDKTIIKGGTSSYTNTTYGFEINDLIKNGYLYGDNYGNVIDMSAFPNPVNMDYRYCTFFNYSSSFSGTDIRFLKINSKLNKETNSLEGVFKNVGQNNSDIFDEPLINEHKACNIIGLDKMNTYNITNMSNMFTYTRIVGNLDFSNWDTSKVIDMTYMFCYSNGSNKNSDYIENYSYLTGLNNWNLQNVQDMHSMFSNSKYYYFQDKELAWNTSNVTNMAFMFDKCNAYNFPKLNFDTSNVTNMAFMFRMFKSNNDLDLNFTDTSKVTNMYYMFSGCGALTKLDLSKWDVSHVTRMDGMFSGCGALTKLDLSKWDVSNITDDSMYSFVYKCKELTTLIDGHEYDPNVVALNGLNKTINLLESTKLNYESVYALFRGLATVTTTETIYLPSVMQGKLDRDKVKIATDKGWTIKYSY